MAVPLLVPRWAARRITVSADDSAVIRQGSVLSWAEKQEAERVAWASARVSNVLDDLLVGD